MTSPHSAADTNSATSLLDLLAVLVEHLRMLLLVPILAGIFAYGIVSLAPVSWTSVMVLRSGSPAIQGLASSAAVLGPTVTTLGLVPGVSFDAAVDRLRSQVKINLNQGNQLLTISVTDQSPEQAQRVARLVWEQLKRASRPIGPEIERLEQQRLDLLRRSDQLESTIQPLMLRLKQGQTDIRPESIRSYGQLLESALRLDAERLALEKQLNGLDDGVLLQPASMPDRPDPRQRLNIALISAVCAAVLLFGFLLLRQGWRNAQQDPVSAEKVNRIRCGWRRFWGAKAV